MWMCFPGKKFMRYSRFLFVRNVAAFESSRIRFVFQPVMTLKEQKYHDRAPLKK